MINKVDNQTNVQYNPVIDRYGYEIMKQNTCKICGVAIDRIKNYVCQNKNCPYGRKTK